MKKIQSGKRTRRDWLGLGGKAVALASLSGCDRLVPIGQSTVKVGLLHSQTGSMAISETSLRDAGLLAIEEINAAGGVLGYPIEPVVEDGRSRFLDEFPKKARKLLSNEKVVALFGCWTSSSRKAVLPLLEELNGLLFYPVQYEGNESSKNIVYTGATPNQQILPAIDWLLSETGGSRKRFFLIGSDYVFPRTANFIVTKYLGSLGIDVVGTSYMPLGHQDFKSAVQAITKSDADVILNTINGDSNIGFYSALAEQGIT
ncbi:MAG: transporter substrate-binding protein, partial [bacterium]